ncbi:hypothetical protein ABZX92_43605, partial [Lentzea sp. NPDC006480]
MAKGNVNPNPSPSPNPNPAPNPTPSPSPTGTGGTPGPTGVVVHFSTPAPAAELLRGSYDLVVGADGVNS